MSHTQKQRILLISHHNSYRIAPYIKAAINLGVYDMDIVSKAGGRILSATATITIKDDLGNPVDGVSVCPLYELATEVHVYGVFPVCDSPLQRNVYKPLFVPLPIPL